MRINRSVFIEPISFPASGELTGKRADLVFGNCEQGRTTAAGLPSGPAAADKSQKYTGIPRTMGAVYVPNFRNCVGHIGCAHTAFSGCLKSERQKSRLSQKGGLQSRCRVSAKIFFMGGNMACGERQVKSAQAMTRNTRNSGPGLNEARSFNPGWENGSGLPLAA